MRFSVMGQVNYVVKMARSLSASSQWNKVAQRIRLVRFGHALTDLIEMWSNVQSRLCVPIICHKKEML